MQDTRPARFFRPEHVDLELVSVAYRERTFPVHIHEQFVIGAVEAGAEMLETQGKTYLVSLGDIITINPDQAHANSALGDELLRYRVFYLPEALVISFTDCPGLRFARPKAENPSGAAQLIELHRWMEAGKGDRLEQELAVAKIIDIAFDAAGRMEQTPEMPDRINRAREYIQGHFWENFGLDELADAAGVSKFHLARSFRKTHGLSPIAYRTQRRIHEAKRLILKGHPLADVAVDLGFADQSHFTRQFQATVGISPSLYREQ